jgi:signal transduction histidine kinase
MIAFSWRILGLSIVISLITASLIFAALQWLLIRPMRRLTDAMVRFRRSPERALDSALISTRKDEFGLAEREFAALRDEVIRALNQKERLAALGTAMGKINHDLRGILASAQLVADRLAGSEDPQVRKMLPALVRSLDRAIGLCTDTLGFGREGPAKPELSRFLLRDLFEEVRESLAKQLDGEKALDCDAPADFSLLADRGHLFRAMRNLIENALQMGAGAIAIRAECRDGRVKIDVSDDGPGLPPKALENLFVPFKGSARVGGSGLGLSTARELMRAQGGDLSLIANGAGGATFQIELPIRHDG